MVCEMYVNSRGVADSKPISTNRIAPSLEPKNLHRRRRMGTQQIPGHVFRTSFLQPSTKGYGDQAAGVAGWFYIRTVPIPDRSIQGLQVPFRNGPGMISSPVGGLAVCMRKTGLPGFPGPNGAAKRRETFGQRYSKGLDSMW